MHTPVYERDTDTTVLAETSVVRMQTTASDVARLRTATSDKYLDVLLLYLVSSSCMMFSK